MATKGKKPTGRHPRLALTDLAVRKKSKPGRYADGNGLYLLVDQNGAKRWILRTVIKGKRTDMGLGSAQLVSLEDARDRAREKRRIARDGGDPLAQARAERRVIPTFSAAARTVHQGNTDGWRNPKHAAQWITSLETYAFPKLGDKPIDAIEQTDVIAVLAPIWTSKPETADRVAQRIGAVLAWAKAHKFRADGLDRKELVLGLPKREKKRARIKHHAALPYAELPAFITALRASDNGIATRLALEFTILTAARTGEVLGAKWSEIQGDRWIVPRERMKAGAEHVVPLSPRCVEILAEAKKLGGEYIFPGRKSGTPLSNMAMLMAMRRMGHTAVPHGMRSVFRTWAAECTKTPAEVVEAALAHTISDAVVAAYKRTTFEKKRAALMAQWAQFATGGTATVVALRAPA